MRTGDLDPNVWCVTGGLGFIGAEVARLIRARRPEDRVVVLDSFAKASLGGERFAAMGFSPAVVHSLSVDRNLTVRDVDVSRAINVNGLWPADEPPNFWIHLAAETHVDNSLDAPAKCVEANVVGTQRMLDLAHEFNRSRGLDFSRRAGVGTRTSCFCYVSTDEVYGSLRSVKDPGFIEDSKLNPSSPYAASKAAGELLTIAAFRSRGTPCVITRGCNTYGPLQAPEKFVPRMIARAMAGEAMPVYGDGRNARQWMDVRDHAEGILAAIERGRNGQAYNLGGDDPPQANLKIAEMVRALCGGGEIQFVEDRPGHDLAYRIDPSRALRELNWRARRGDLNVGAILEMREWFVDHPEWLAKFSNKFAKRVGLAKS